MSKGTLMADRDTGPRPEPGHVPVLVERCLELLAPALDESPGAVCVDATVGAAGHAAAVLDAYPGLVLVGLDRDPDALSAARARLTPHAQRVHLVHATFDELAGVLERLGIDGVRAVLFDLGVSSLQLDSVERGFSYSREAPLDMRMDRTAGRTAAEVVNTYSRQELARVLADYGEERFAGRIAEAIVTARHETALDSTAQLVELVYRAVPAAARRRGGHPAKRTFQALRIEVNAELGGLGDALSTALDVLEVGGRVVSLAYHSLEDRIVKRTLTRLAGSRSPLGLPVELAGHEPQLRLLTRGAETATPDDVAANPRASSVRLRAAERITPPSGAQVRPDDAAGRP